MWFQSRGNHGPTGVSADGRIAVSVALTSTTLGGDLWAWTAGGAPEGVPLIAREGDQVQAQVSPDGRWLAYVSNETGRNEVFVAPFRHDPATGKAEAGESVPVSAGGGFAPRWRGDGQELLYLKVDGSVMAVDAGEASSFPAAPARRLFTVPGAFPEWGLTRDGRRLLFAVPTAPPPPLQIIQNWQAALPE